MNFIKRDILDPVKIYVPDKVRYQLLYDQDIFEISSMNKMITHVIKGFADEFIKTYNQKRDSIIDSLSSSQMKRNIITEKAHKILEKIYLPSYNNEKEKKNPISYRLTKEIENDDILEEIESFIKDGSNLPISRFFCYLLMSYCAKPMFERERIIFSDTYNKLKLCINKKRSISFRSYDTEQIDFTPYDICAKNDGTLNYLIGVKSDGTDDNLVTRSFRLSGISRIKISKEPCAVINTDTMKQLKKMEFRDPQYAINETEEICVQLTEKGETIFKRIYSERPDYTRKEGSLYYFDCSPDQIFVYFRKLGKEAKIIYPEGLRDRMCEFFEETLVKYREDRNGKYRNI